MAPGLRTEIFNIIDFLVEFEAVYLEDDDGGCIDISADKIDEAVEKVINAVKRRLDKDKEEK